MFRSWISHSFFVKLSVIMNSQGLEIVKEELSFELAPQGTKFE